MHPFVAHWRRQNPNEDPAMTRVWSLLTMAIGLMFLGVAIWLVAVELGLATRAPTRPGRPAPVSGTPALVIGLVLFPVARLMTKAGSLLLLPESRPLEWFWRVEGLVFAILMLGGSAALTGFLAWRLAQGSPLQVPLAVAGPVTLLVWAFYIQAARHGSRGAEDPS